MRESRKLKRSDVAEIWSVGVCVFGEAEVTGNIRQVRRAS